MIFMPPGSAKSTYASVLFPAHYMGRFAGQKIISASYNSKQAAKFGRKTRNLTETPAYGRIFDTGLTKDSKAKGEWELTNGSSYLGVGVDAGVTGNRADGAIVDDPIKGRKDAESETVCQSTWEWYDDDLDTRLKPDAWLIWILTRWTQDDPVGRILPEDWDGESGDIECRDGQIWHVLCLPAKAREHDPLGRKPGEWLWTEWFTPKFWETIWRKKKDRTLNSLYQQVPSSAEGTFFKREWFWRFDPNEVEVRKYQTGDFAVTEAADADNPDYTEIGVHGAAKDKDGETRLYLCIDGWYGQKSVDNWIPQYFRLVKKHRPRREFAEVGVIRRAIEGTLKQQRKQRKARGQVVWLPHIGDKEANAWALAEMAEMGFVGIANTEYGDHVLEQLVRFPAGKFDDAVDMAALMARVIDEAHPQVGKLPEVKKKVDRWDKAFDDDEATSWKVA